MKRIAAVGVMCFAVAALASAQSVVVEYLEGSVELREGNSWYAVSIGASLESDAELRLGQGAYAEIAGSSETITLTRPGTYDLSSIIESAQENRSANVGSLMFDRVKSLGGGDSSDEQRDTTVGGVRASEAAQGPEVDWAGAESATALIAEGKARLSEEDYDEAYFLFEEAYAIASSAEENEAQFYMGYSAYLSGRQREAVRALTAAQLQPDSDYYADHVLTLAQIYVETFAFEDAVNVVEEYLNEHSPEGEDRQTALLLAGMGYKGMENPSEARRYLNQAQSMDASAGVREAAQRVLQQL